MLIVGIESEEGRRMFDERENDFLRSLEMGDIAMAAGIGRIADEGYTRSVSVDEAAFRFRTVARDLLKDNEDGTSPSWNPPYDSGVKACPYLFIYPGTRCSLDHSGEAVVGGMNWMGSYLPPAENMGEVLHEQHVIDLATEAALTSHETLEGLYASGAQLQVTTTTLDTHASTIDDLAEGPLRYGL